MKVHIGKYKSWISPYQIAKYFCFWAKDDIINSGYPITCINFGTWLAEDKNRERLSSWLRFVARIDSKRKRKVKIKMIRITWNTDHTCTYCFAALKQLKETITVLLILMTLMFCIWSYNAKPRGWVGSDEFHHNSPAIWWLSEVARSLEQLCWRQRRR